MMEGEPDPLDVLAELMRPPAWHARAACRGMGTEAFIIDRGVRPAEGRAVCATCSVTAECLAAGLADKDSVGLWGGTTAQERRVLRRGRRVA